MPGTKTRYIASLDGLRAFAVLAVIAYHFGFSWASGGLLGVTVFFVLSGYLITSLLLAEFVSTRTIDLKAFWMRRVKRLFPAIVFLVISVVALCAIFNHDLLTKMRPDVPPSLFFYSNWWYIFRNVSYFETVGAPSPLTHCWSLAIEEQFYLIWPPLLFFLFSRRVRKKNIIRTVFVIAAVSVILMVLLYNPNADPSRVYYGTDTRAFSLLMGALLAFLWPGNQLARAGDLELSPAVNIALNGVGIAAFIGLVAMNVFVDGFSPFMYRGGILLASLLTVIVIAVLVHPKSLLGKFTSLPPLVWIGKRSYGMYLWHFPITLLMTPVNFTGTFAWWYYLLELAVIVAAAAFSYRFIENPIRKGALGKFVKDLRQGDIRLGQYLQKHLLPAGAATVVTLFSVGAFIFVPPVSAVSDLAALAQQGDPANATQPDQTGDTAEAVQPANILLIGDSVSVRAIPYFEETFPDGIIDSAVNRQLYDGYIVYDYYAQKGLVGDIVVFALGTNSPAVDEQIDTLMDDVGPDKTVYFINTRSPQPWESTTNDTLARATGRYNNVYLIDWFSYSANHDDWFDGDGTHLNEEGAQAYVEMVRGATGLPLPEATTAQDEAPA
ncbi:MAG: acetyltransferase [Eggerthellaceae bacterium]|nr:acetyltransferase [Eggerthellaceae bacterium]